MAPSLSFSYKPRLNQYPGRNTYLNQNIWLQIPVTPPVDVGSPTDPPNRTETLIPTPGEDYCAYGVVSNQGSEPSGNMNLAFFLCIAATQPSLSAPETLFLGTGARNGFDGDATGRGWAIWKSESFTYSTPPQGEHYCLVAVMFRYITNPEGREVGERNKYFDPGEPGRPGAAVPGAHAEINDPIIAQRNYFEAARKRISGSRITHVSHFNVSGSSRAEGSSLTLRQPDHGELVALQDMLGRRGRSIRDMTAEARAGVFDSDPSREDHDPDQDKKLQKLPLTLRIQNLEPGCVRRIYLGLELPHAETKSTTAAFVLTEQVTSDGKLVGGVAVVALNGDATSLE
ncbi:hypothetical protein FOVSG1_006443 [Fusarium oxysporum f. sp. vasinfectum]